jgi:SAM-dependent methyltransferase
VPTEPKYTLEGSQASEVMARRDASRCAAFLSPRLSPGMRLLDCGCGPGGITLGLAQIVYPGEVVGIDTNRTDIQIAKSSAIEQGIANVTFQVGNASSPDFPDGSFDAVFFHGVLCHLTDPLRALREARRVLRDGGILGAREPYARGHIRYPPDAVFDRRLELYFRLRRHNGGDPAIGERLCSLFREAGFADVSPSASYETLGTPESRHTLRLLAAMLSEPNSRLARQLA